MKGIDWNYSCHVSTLSAVNSLLLEHNNGIGFQIAHIDLFALLLDVGMFSAEQPTHVGKEEATSGVVGIGISVREFVMDAMIACPLVNAILEGERLAQHKENTQRHLGFVGTMRPQTMNACGNAHAAQKQTDVC